MVHEFLNEVINPFVQNIVESIKPIDIVFFVPLTTSACNIPTFAIPDIVKQAVSKIISSVFFLSHRYFEIVCIGNEVSKFHMTHPTDYSPGSFSIALIK